MDCDYFTRSSGRCPVVGRSNDRDRHVTTVGCCSWPVRGRFLNANCDESLFPGPAIHSSGSWRILCLGGHQAAVERLLIPKLEHVSGSLALKILFKTREQLQKDGATLNAFSRVSESGQCESPSGLRQDRGRLDELGVLVGRRLPVDARRQRDVALVAIEAGARAGGNIGLVGQVLHVEGELPLVPVIAQRGVVGGV